MNDTTVVDMVGVDGKWWIDMFLRILVRNIHDRVQVCSVPSDVLGGDMFS